MSGLSCECEHAAQCHDDERGCQYHGNGANRCRCLRDSDTVVAEVVARHVRAALTEAAERVKRAGHGDEPLNDEARAVYGTHFYNDAARIVRNLSPDG